MLSYICARYNGIFYATSHSNILDKNTNRLVYEPAIGWNCIMMFDIPVELPDWLLCRSKSRYSICGQSHIRHLVSTKIQTLRNTGRVALDMRAYDYFVGKLKPIPLLKSRNVAR